VEIRSGERVALLGHNGAGKSTLLRTVAGLYPVSSGLIEVTGEIRALLDISLGFEPDATGRANIRPACRCVWRLRSPPSSAAMCCCWMK
jgi:lipopolysaccharide transport system ATP-binding protein